jgi:deoxycytidine triphosphate deaminase
MGRKEDESERLASYECPERDERADKPCGVLLSDEIQRCVSAFRMIDPFTAKNLKPAGYELTVGDQYSLGGQVRQLAEGEKITIPPFQVVIIKIAETLNLPRFLIARWNIRVKWAYEGLLWVGGPQVDPGWVGPLSCPIYNLSDREVKIPRGEPVAVIDFVTTTPFHKGKSKEYEHRPPKRLLFEDYNTDLKSALFTEAGQRISTVENRIGSVETQVNTSISVAITILTILFAVLALFVSPPTGRIPWWLVATVVFSLVALVLSIYAFFKMRSLTGK